MTNTATFRRTSAALCLALTAALAAGSNATAPDFPPDAADRLAALESAGGRAWVSSLTFVVAQLPWFVAVLGLGHLVRQGAPRLANLGTAIAVAGGFGHAVFGGVSLTTLVMAQDETHRAELATVLDDLESSPVMAFALLGLVGTVLGLVLLASALWRAGVGPRWVPPLLGAFVAVEFVGTSLSAWSAQVSGVMFLLAFGALARTVWLSEPTAWETATGHRHTEGLLGV